MLSMLSKIIFEKRIQSMKQYSRTVRVNQNAKDRVQRQENKAKEKNNHKYNSASHSAPSERGSQ